jgi:hypothetical protein
MKKTQSIYLCFILAQMVSAQSAEFKNKEPNAEECKRNH